VASEFIGYPLLTPDIRRDCLRDCRDGESGRNGAATIPGYRAHFKGYGKQNKSVLPDVITQSNEAMETYVRKITLYSIAGLGALLSVQPALAESCYDLWYERNAIYDRNGFCFSSDLGQQTFDNSDCWTKHAKFSRSEQRQIDAIKEEEESRGCNVN
jgi:hypothetical protein